MHMRLLPEVNSGGLFILPKARHIYPSLVLVQPRKTRPCLTERLLMGCKESNQTKQNKSIYIKCSFARWPDKHGIQISHCMYLYQVNMTLRFLNDLDDVESRINNYAFIITILKSEPIINELQSIVYVVSKRKQTVFSNNIYIF